MCVCYRHSVCRKTYRQTNPCLTSSVLKHRPSFKQGASLLQISYPEKQIKINDAYNQKGEQQHEAMCVA